MTCDTIIRGEKGEQQCAAPLKIVRCPYLGVLNKEKGTVKKSPFRVHPICA